MDGALETSAPPEKCAPTEQEEQQQSKKCTVYLVGALETSAPPERTPIKNLPRISQMRTDISCWDILLQKLPQIARMCTD